VWISVIVDDLSKVISRNANNVSKSGIQVRRTWCTLHPLDAYTERPLTATYEAKNFNQDRDKSARSVWGCHQKILELGNQFVSTAEVGKNCFQNSKEFQNRIPLMSADMTGSTIKVNDDVDDRSSAVEGIEQGKHSRRQ
jgi:hypothetical protein